MKVAIFQYKLLRKEEKQYHVLEKTIMFFSVVSTRDIVFSSFLTQCAAVVSQEYLLYVAKAT